MIGYHYSPSDRHQSIHKHGLLVPTKHPKLVQPVVCSEGHRNPHVSLASTPSCAWSLSGGFLYSRVRDRRGTEDLSYLEEMHSFWDLYQVDLDGIRYNHRGGYEIQVRTDIPRYKVLYIGSRGLAS